MRRLIASLLFAVAGPAAAQTPPPNQFYAPTNIAVETAGSAEIRIVRAPGSDNGQPSSFHIGTSDMCMCASAIWPADYPNPVDQTVTIQPGQNFTYVTIPITYHNSFQDTKTIALRIEPMANAAIDRANPMLVVYDGDISHMDAWKPAPSFTQNGYAQLRVDAPDGGPKIETLFGDKPVQYYDVYPGGTAGEVFRVTGFGFSAVSNRPVLHVVALNRSPRDSWFYQDDMQPVQPAVWLGDPTVPH